MSDRLVKALEVIATDEVCRRAEFRIGPHGLRIAYSKGEYLGEVHVSWLDLRQPQLAAFLRSRCELALQLLKSVSDPA